MHKVLSLLLLVVSVSGCASPSDIDLSKAEPACGKDCSTNYSQCVGKFTLFPAIHKSDCADALKLCAQACPARGEKS